MVRHMWAEALASPLAPPQLRRRLPRRGHGVVGEGRESAVALEAHAGTPVREELDELGAAHDARAGHEIVLVELALLEARRAHVDHAARLREVIHQLSQWREAVLVDRLCAALVGEAHALDAQEHERLL